MEKELLFLAKNSNFIIDQWIYRKYYKIFIKYIYKMITQKFISIDLEVDDFKQWIYETIKSVCKESNPSSIKEMIGFVKRRIYFLLVNLLRQNLKNSNLIMTNLIVDSNENEKDDQNQNEEELEIGLTNKLFVEEILDFLKNYNRQIYYVIKLIYEGYTPYEIAKITKLKIETIYYFIKKAKQICKKEFNL